MNNNVNITITGISDDEVNNDEIVVEMAGQYYFKNNKHYIMYKEQPDPRDPDSINNNMITISQNNNGMYRVELTKKGVQRSKMSFFTGEKYASSYPTPYGTFLLLVETHSLGVLIDVSNIYIDITYDLYMNDNFTSHNRIKINVGEML